MALHAMDLPPVSGGAYGEAARRERAPVLVVGYDGSANARAALLYAAERASDGGQVLIAQVYGPSESWFGTPSYQPASEDDLRAGHALAAAAEEEIPAGVRHETLLCRGAPPTVLRDIATERDADEIVVGAHGSDPKRRGLGSVPLALLEVADRPVVVITQRAARRIAQSDS